MNSCSTGAKNSLPLSEQNQSTHDESSPSLPLASLSPSSAEWPFDFDMDVRRRPDGQGTGKVPTAVASLAVVPCPPYTNR